MNIGDKYIVTRLCMVTDQVIEIVDIIGRDIYYKIVSSGIMDSTINENEISRINKTEFNKYYLPVERQSGKLYDIWVDELNPKNTDDLDVIYDKYIIGVARANSFKNACNKFFEASGWMEKYYDEENMTWQGRMLLE